MKKKIIHKDKVRKHFDCWAENYDTGQITNWLRTLQKQTISAMSPRSFNHVLDVGCGTGWAVLHISQILTEGRACGIDISPAMIQKARANAAGLENIEFKVGGAENIPYDNEQYDLVMSTSSFHHYPDPVRALREFWRILKPGGNAYILDTCRDGSLFVFLYDIGHKILMGDHVRYYHTSEIKEFFIKAGFKDVLEEFRKQRLFWHKKFLTSVVLISARKK